MAIGSGGAPILNTRVVQVNDWSICMKAEGDDVTEIAAQMTVRAAGVSASPLAAPLAHPRQTLSLPVA